MDSALQKAISKGAKLKKVETNDRSQAAVGGRVIDESSAKSSSSQPKPPPPPASSSGPPPPPPSAPPMKLPGMAPPPPPAPASAASPPPPPPPSAPAPAASQSTSPPPPPPPSASSSSPSAAARAGASSSSPSAAARAGASSSGARKVEALYDYKAENDDDLAMFQGDMVTVLEEPDEDGWMKGALGGKEGYFPASYVKDVPGSGAPGASPGKSKADAARPDSTYDELFGDDEKLDNEFATMFDDSQSNASEAGASGGLMSIDAGVATSTLDFGSEVVHVHNSNLAAEDKLAIDDTHWWEPREKFYSVTVEQPETKKKTFGKNKELYAVATPAKGWRQVRAIRSCSCGRVVVGRAQGRGAVFSKGKPSAHFPVDPAEDRRRQLERFLLEVTRHPVLRAAPALRHFLGMAADGSKSTRKAFKESRRNIERDPLVGKAFITRVAVYTDPNSAAGYNYIDEYTMGSNMATPLLAAIEAASISVGNAQQVSAASLNALGKALNTYQHPADSQSLKTAIKAVGSAACETAKLENAHATAENVLIRRIRSEHGELKKQAKVAALESKTRRKFVSAVLKLQKKGIEATAQQRQDTLALGGLMRAQASVSLAELHHRQHTKNIDFKADLARYAELQIEFYEAMAAEWKKAAGVVAEIDADDSWFQE
ncbi:uncharacterized protein AMSG_00010 [Thecamonas trahens ATCC 50062]|uniref:SH3 domain-containing protein n=1 Tax=Thecamonas trahens ATCC 50062 TaxID=461836 RepID=A0A0L0D0Z3_THETB|nr:hypothetical protein AMSG_00010 [Thecamonas trahens ATCC 50062]KNC45896.1 hypothetical protein AMSG_00010 [Thecamonas trahens ATCC 50062]|eukprot:XP_013762884.1 hypothetical protein AMSG_00010 [Thecamonas trahens ATCC 50062]